MSHRTHHPNEAGDRRKSQRLASQTNNHHTLHCRTLFVLILLLFSSVKLESFSLEIAHPLPGPGVIAAAIFVGARKASPAGAFRLKPWQLWEARVALFKDRKLPMPKWIAAAIVILGMGAGAPASAARSWPSPLVAELAAKDMLNGDDLVAITQLAEANRSVDLTPLIDKPFHVDVTPDPSVAEGPHWWYDQQHQALSLHAPIGRLSGRYFALRGCDGEMTSARGIEIYRTGVRHSETGRTPDGAAQMFDRIEQHRVSLGGLVCGPPTTASGLNTNVNEDRRRARDQLGSLQATIEGYLKPVDGQGLVACAGEQIAATTTDPTQLVVHQCVVGAAVQRIAFSAHGVELAFWDAARDQRPVHHRRRWMRAPHLPRLPRL
jgi:hypothetical protein